MATNFRFQNFEIWKRAADLSKSLFEIADDLDSRKKYRFAEQLRAATLSITNNIAEGAGSSSDIDFKHFLNMSRRSIFEVVNMIMLFSRQGLLESSNVEVILDELEEESKMISGFMTSLKEKAKGGFQKKG